MTFPLVWWCAAAQRTWLVCRSCCKVGRAERGVADMNKSISNNNELIGAFVDVADIATTDTCVHLQRHPPPTPYYSS